MTSEGNIKIKSPKDIKLMAEGGKILARVKNALEEKVDAGVSAYEIEELASLLIKKEGAEESFKKVPGYHWATCVNVNEGIVHGIPKKDVVFKKGDVVSIDCGVFYKGFHTDTSITKGIDVDDKLMDFIDTGKSALNRAVKKAVPGGRIYDISEAIESTLLNKKLTPIRALVGHGVGRELHEAPAIYCFTHGKRTDSPEIKEGMVLAIEVMYSFGNGEVGIEEDQWTISTSDGTISGLFEDTVAVTKNGPLILTDSY